MPVPSTTTRRPQKTRKSPRTRKPRKPRRPRSRRSRPSIVGNTRSISGTPSPTRSAPDPPATHGTRDRGLRRPDHRRQRKRKPSDVDDSNLFFHRIGILNGNTGDTDTSGLNVVDATCLTVRSGNSWDRSKCRPHLTPTRSGVLQLPINGASVSGDRRKRSRNATGDQTHVIGRRRVDDRCASRLRQSQRGHLPRWERRDRRYRRRELPDRRQRQRWDGCHEGRGLDRRRRRCPRRQSCSELGMRLPHIPAALREMDGSRSLPRRRGCGGLGAAHVFRPRDGRVPTHLPGRARIQGARQCSVIPSRSRRNRTIALLFRSGALPVAVTEKQDVLCGSFGDRTERWNAARELGRDLPATCCSRFGATGRVEAGGTDGQFTVAAVSDAGRRSGRARARYAQPADPTVLHREALRPVTRRADARRRDLRVGVVSNGRRRQGHLGDHRRLELLQRPEWETQRQHRRHRCQRLERHRREPIRRFSVLSPPTRRRGKPLRRHWSTSSPRIHATTPPEMTTAPKATTTATQICPIRVPIPRTRR